MPREGTRSATGNSKPRVFQTVDTEPTIKRTVAPKKKKTVTTEPTTSTTKGVKPVGVTKKKTPAKSTGVVAKAKAVVKKVEKKAAPKKATKPRTTTKTSAAAV